MRREMVALVFFINDILIHIMKLFSFNIFSTEYICQSIWYPYPYFWQWKYAAASPTIAFNGKQFFFNKNEKWMKMNHQHDVMKKYGPNTENLSHAALRLGTKLWRLRAPLTSLHATFRLKPQTLLPESSVLTIRPLRQPLKFGTKLKRHYYSCTNSTDQGDNRQRRTREREVTAETVWIRPILQ